MNHQPKGQSDGGQFAVSKNQEASVDLIDCWPESDDELRALVASDVALLESLPEYSNESEDVLLTLSDRQKVLIARLERRLADASAPSGDTAAFEKWLAREIDDEESNPPDEEEEHSEASHLDTLRYVARKFTELTSEERPGVDVLAKASWSRDDCDGFISTMDERYGEFHSVEPLSDLEWEIYAETVARRFANGTMISVMEDHFYEALQDIVEKRALDAQSLVYEAHKAQRQYGPDGE